jgi:hypothetical protein
MTFRHNGLASLAWDGHLLLLHHSDNERTSRLAAWVRRGLEHGEQVLYGQDDPVAPHDSVLAELGDHGIDVQAATTTGQLQVIPVPALFAGGHDGLVARIEQARAAGYRGLRLSAQDSRARTGAPEETYPWLADSLERLYHTQPLSALCQYKWAATVGTRLEQAATAHIGGIRESQLRTAPAKDGLILFGEVDASNELLLLATIRAATTRAAAGTDASRGIPASRFSLDMRRVAFLSVGGCRALAVGTRRFREHGGHLRLLAPMAIVARALRLAELDTLPNVEIVESPL